jgi:hypothetical protein
MADSLTLATSASEAFLQLLTPKRLTKERCPILMPVCNEQNQNAILDGTINDNKVVYREAANFRAKIISSDTCSREVGIQPTLRFNLVENL